NSYNVTRSGDVYLTNTTERNSASAEGRVLPTEQNSYNVTRSGDVYLSNTTENSTTSAEGKILPTEQNSYNISRSGDVYLANTTENSTISAEGKVLPTEQNSYNVTRSGDVYLSNTTENSAANASAKSGDVPERANGQSAVGSYRSRLDGKTLAALDEMISKAGKRTASAETAEAIKEKYAGTQRSADTGADLTYTQREEELRELPPMRTLAGSAALDRAEQTRQKTADIMRRGMGIAPANSSRHITALTHRTGAEPQLSGAERSFRYRTVDSGENMVMLIPPTEMDRYQAEYGYKRQMPPIELKQPPSEPPATPASKVNRAVNVKSTPVQVQTTGSVDNMSRDEINKLVDKVYDKLEARLLRERRRRGL
ncbi:MAG: hypothetical protein ACI4KA_08095, partial [Oscillospiraceae bacterium]